MWAKTSAPASYLDFFQRSTADTAGLAIPAINIKMFLMAALFTIAIAIISKGSASISNPLGNNLIYCELQFGQLWQSQAACLTQRMNPCQKQGLIHIDIPQSPYLPLVKQKAFYFGFAPLGSL